MLKSFLLVLALPLLFVGCSIDQSGTIDPSSIDADECAESGGEFCSTDGSSVSLQLSIKTKKIITASSNGDCYDRENIDQFCFDISGDCNEAGLDTASIVATSSISGSPVSLTLGSCKRGRFHVQLRMNIAPADRGITHRVYLELVGKKADGSEIRQPAKARKPIDILVPKDPV